MDFSEVLPSPSFAISKDGLSSPHLLPSLCKDASFTGPVIIVAPLAKCAAGVPSKPNVIEFSLVFSVPPFQCFRAGVVKASC
jgi:hypothetical protein